jgi:uncharacterized RDD family membrane protein YckC
MQWYYAVNGQRMGPVSEIEFQKLVQDGTIKSDTLVWRQGFSNWQPYSTVAPAAGAPARGDPSAGGPVGSVDETEICAVSGKRYPKSQMIQYEGKWISAEHRDEYFQRMREGVTQPGHFVYGGFWVRFLAKFLDGLILWVCSAAFNAVLALFFFKSANFLRPDMHGVSLPSLFAYQGLSMAISIIIGLSYAIFFIRRFDATPGKMALGLKLVRADGSSLSVGRIVGRHFAEWISGMILLIGYIMAGFDDEKRALHDRICDTRVIKAR